MKSLLLIAIAITLSSLNLYSQDYLQTNKDSILNPGLEKGIPAIQEFHFINFDDNTDYSYIEGLSENTRQITSRANIAKIVIRQNNIGRVVLYTRIFNPKDSSRFSPLNNRNGKITITAFRGEVKVQEITKVREFSESGFQQFHFNTFKSGIDKVEIVFESSNHDYRFLVDKLKAIPYTKEGAAYYRKREKTEYELNTWTDTLSLEAEKIKRLYIEQLASIENYHKTLSTLISGQTFQDVAVAKSSSLNPFADNNFIDVYEKMLDKASEADKKKFEKLSKDLSSPNLTQVAMSLDNIILGGKFGSMINLIDGLFDTQITLKNESSEDVEILLIDGQYFSKSGGNKLKLTPVDQVMKREIIAVKTENDAMKQYMSDISEFIQSDAEYYRMISEDIALAKRLKQEMEDLIKSIIDDCLIENSTDLMNGEVNFTKISTSLNDKFIVDQTRSVSEMWFLKSASIKNIKRFNDLKADYYEIISRIKTHYDILYEINPGSRLSHFDDVNALPDALKKSWREKQQALIALYTKEEGLQQLLSDASGKEF